MATILKIKEYIRDTVTTKEIVEHLSGGLYCVYFKYFLKKR